MRGNNLRSLLIKLFFELKITFHGTQTDLTSKYTFRFYVVYENYGFT
jgi:hypothetical protein